MRNISTILALMLLPLFIGKVSAQTPADTTIYEVVEKMPEYPGGIEVITKYIRTCTKNYWERVYPEGKPVYPCEQGIVGRVVVSLTINENGQVTDPEILRSSEKDLDKEAIRIVKSMPRWIPGEHKGKKVKVRFTLPIQF